MSLIRLASLKGGWVLQALTAAVTATSRGSRDTCSNAQWDPDQWDSGEAGRAPEGGQQRALSLRLLSARRLTGWRSVMYTIVSRNE